MIILIKHSDGTEIQEDLEKDVVVIGRSSASDVVVKSDHISRSHLEVRKEGDKIFIKDLTDSNWVSCDGEQMPKGEAIQYLDFMNIVLPGDFSVSISHPSSKERREDKTSVTEIRTLAKTRTLSRTDIIKTNSPPKKRNVKMSEDDEVDNKEKIKKIIILLLLLVLVYIAVDLFILT